MTAYDQKLTAKLLADDTEWLEYGVHKAHYEKVIQQLRAASERIERLERALESIEQYYAAEFREGENAYQAVIIARAALAGDEEQS